MVPVTTASTVSTTVGVSGATVRTILISGVGIVGVCAVIGVPVPIVNIAVVAVAVAVCTSSPGVAVGTITSACSTSIRDWVTVSKHNLGCSRLNLPATHPPNPERCVQRTRHASPVDPPVQVVPLVIV